MSSDPFGSSSDADPLLRALAATPSVAALPAFAPGVRLGRFEIVRRLGQGSFGAVFEARDTELGRHVAVKVMRPRSNLDLWRREATAGARMDHPGIVTVHDLGVREGHAYIVLELLRGETLQHRLDRELLAADDALRMLIEITEAVAHAHAHGVVHRDLKPSNIFVLENGRTKVLDFGLATGDAGPSPLHRAGTRPFMAPEQERGDHQDVRVDIFALGVLLGMLTAEPPAHIVATATAEDRTKRYPTAAALLDALRVAQRALWHHADGDEPYRYLDAFTEADAPWFFGRDREIAQLVRILTHAPVGTVVGPSGAGKSSLVRAGLVPHLRATEPWDVVVLRPGDQPVPRLARRVGELLGTSIAPEPLREHPGRLAVLLRSDALRRQRRILIVVDQLEELVTRSSPEDARAFLAMVTAAADDVDGPVRAVFCVRDDHLGQVTRVEGAVDALGRGLLLLAPPDTRGLTDALVDPARQLGVTIEPDLATHIVSALQSEVAPLPLLQLSASRLWDRRNGSTSIGLSDLAEAGGVTGVLAAHAEEVLGGLHLESDVRIAMQILVALVGTDGTRSSSTVQALVGGSADEARARAVVEHLVHGRLLTASRGAEIELSHESLIAGWQRLADHCAQDQDAQRMRERVSAAAALWEEQGQPDELLWYGQTLAAAQRWQAGYDGLVGDLAHRFLDRATARARRRQRASTLLTAATVLIALFATVWAIQGKATADAEAKAERLRGIVRAAMLSKDPMIAALSLASLPEEDLPVLAQTAAHSVLQRARPIAVLRGHRGPILMARFSPDGRWVASASYDRTVRISPADGRGDAHVLEHGGELLTLEFTPDGRHLVTGGRDGHTTMWPVPHGEPTVFTGCRASVYEVATTNDHVASACGDGAVRIWDREGSTPVQVIEHDGPAWRVRFSPDGRWVATAGADHVVHIARLGGSSTAHRGHTGIPRALAFRPDGGWVASGGDDGDVRLWPVADGEPRVLQGHDARIWSLQFSPDGQRLLSASEDDTARIWDLARDAEPVVLHGAENWAVFSPDGDQVLASHGDGSAWVWPLHGLRDPWRFEGHRQPISTVQYSPDGTQLLTASDDATVRVWQARAPTPHHEPPEAVGTLMTVAVAPRGDRILGGAIDGTVWSWPTDEPDRGTRLAEHALRVIDVELSHDGARFASISLDGSARLGTVDPAQPARTLVAPRSLVHRVQFSPDDTRLLTTHQDGTSWLWPVTGGEPTVLACDTRANGSSFGPDGEVVMLSRRGVCVFDGDSHWSATSTHELTHGRMVGEQIVATTATGQQLVWDRATPDTPAVIGQTAVVRAMAVRRSGDAFTTAAVDGTAQLWVAHNGVWSTGPTLSGHRGPITSVQYTADGERLITSGSDGTVRLWSADTGTQLLQLTRGGAPLDLVVSDRSSATLVAASHAGTIDVWRLADWSQMRTALRAGSSACLSVSEREEWLGESAATATDAASACERRAGRSVR